MASVARTRSLVRDILAAAGTLLIMGNVFYVDNTHANAADKANTSTPSGNSYGKDPDYPFDTLDYAIGQCTADNGDHIVVAEGHAETGAAAAFVDADKAGITITGMGSGATRPTFTFGTATSTDIDIDAANITFKNLRFVSAFDDLAVMLDVNLGGFTCEDCEFVALATFECLNFINLATTKDDFIFRRCKFLQPADPAGTDGAAATGGIYLVDTENVLIEDCVFDGFFETACVHNKTTACKFLKIIRTTMNQQLTITGKRWLFPASTVGVVIDYAGDATWYPGLGYKVTKTEDGETATSDALFTLSGKVDITLWTGEVTNALGATAKFSDYKIELTTLAGILIAAGDISSSIIGHIFTLNADAGDTSLSTSTSAVSVAGVGDTQGKGGHLVVGKSGGSDVIKATRTAGDAGDAIVHTVFWMPLEVEAHLTAAA